ncbi:hypothetical protein GCM10023347_08320 [Streptomyces chumphonensis]
MAQVARGVGQTLRILKADTTAMETDNGGEDPCGGTARDVPPAGDGRRTDRSGGWRASPPRAPPGNAPSSPCRAPRCRRSAHSVRPARGHPEGGEAETA